jgi:Mrp family chromosome partitioning ATPase
VGFGLVRRSGIRIVSKIYDALRKSQEERRRTKPDGEADDREDTTERSEPPPGAGELPTARGGDDEGFVVELPALDGFSGRFWDSVHHVTASIEAAASGKSLSAIFVGAEPSVGTTTLTLATCYQLTRDPGVDVLLVDAHAREDANALLPTRPNGLIQLLLGDVRLAESIVQTTRSGLSYLARGTGSYHGPKLFDRIAPLMKNLSSGYDYLILDSAPAVIAPETAKLAALCDAAIVVVASERTPKAGALRTKQVLDEHKVRILGSVINRARRTSLLGNG